MVHPNQQLIKSLRNRVRQIEDASGRRQPGEPRYEPVPTRLDDGLFPETVSTPHGTVPVFSHSMGMFRSSLVLPRELALIWDIPSGKLGSVMSLDIETSGPIGGSGGLPFVLGMATVRDEIISLEQVILRTPEDEMAALWYLEQCANTNDTILTYNGMRFDYPILRKRFQSYGTPWEETHINRCHSIDLEGFIRSAHLPLDEGAKLMELEKYILSLFRPSWSWHEIWAGRSKLDISRRRRLAKLLAKNGYDCVSLFHLLDAAVSMVEEPHRCIDTLGAFLGKKLHYLDSDRSLRWYKHAASVSISSRYTVKAAIEAWCLASDDDKLRIFAPALRRGVAANVPGAWKAAERLGLYEKRCGNSSESVKWTELSIQLSPPLRSKERLIHRLQRYKSDPSRGQDD